MPAGDAHFLDHEAEELLALLEVEPGESGEDPLREGRDAVMQTVLLGQGSALFDQGGALVLEGLPSGIQFLGPPLELQELDETCLVQIDEPTAFRVSGVHLAIESGELCGEKLVVGRRGGRGDGPLARQQDLRTLEHRTHLFEDEGIEGVRADVPFGAAPVLAAGPQRVVIPAVVVTMAGPIAPAHPVAADPDATRAALEQVAQQPLARLDLAGAPFRVVAAHVLRGLKEIVGDELGHGDGNPLLAGPAHLARLLPGAAGGRRLGPVLVGAPDERLVA